VKLVNSFHLLIVDQSSSGSLHVKLEIDSKESGILYLSQKQFDAICDGMKSYCYENNLSFSVENPFDISSYEDDEDDYEQ